MSNSNFWATLLFGCLLAAGAGAETLETGGFTRRCTVTFEGYAGTSTLTNFPALVRLPAGSPLYAVSADGSDLRFADAVGNLVPCEIDTWNTNGVSSVWVCVPELAEGTTLTLYAGGTCSQAANPRAVWSAAGYTGVWHFSGNANDSSANDLDMKVSATKPSFAQPTPVGTGFYGTGSSYVYTEDAAVTNGLSGTNFTLSGWVKSKTDGYYGRIFSTKKNYADAKGVEITQQGSATKMMVGGPGGKQMVVSIGRSMKNEFVYFAAVYRDGNVTLYIDGARASVTNGYAVNLQSDYPLALGAIGGVPSQGRWQGWLDELRVQGGAQSADWAAADYATQRGALFATLGAVETLEGRALFDPTPFSRSCTITFSGYRGASTLTNFPALVRVPASVGRLCAPNGADIRFADADGCAIPHEVDTWNAAGESTVWVRVPALAGRATAVRMYFGGQPATVNDARSVWNAGYKAVWHFAGEKQDSSPNALAMYATGTMTYTGAGPVGTVFESTGGYLYTTNSAAWAGFDDTGFAVSYWVKMDAAYAKNANRMLSTKRFWNAENGFEITSQDSARAITVHGRSNSQLSYKTAPDYTQDFIYLTAVYHDSSADLYINGERASSVTNALYNISGVTNTLALGAAPGVPDQRWRGQLDEMRLRWARPDADWIQADYDTQQTNTSFAVFGPVEDRVAGPVLETRPFRRKARVTFAGAAETLVGFPALVRIPAGSEIYRTAADGGADLRFTDLEGRLLAHEIDIWNTNGESCVWVRVPELGTDGAQALLYWNVPQDLADVPLRPATSVWTLDGYRFVFHFTGGATDSTGFGLETLRNGTSVFTNLSAVGTGVTLAANYSSIVLPCSSAWADYEETGFTLSCWAKSDWASGNNGKCDRILSTKTAHTDATGFELTTQNWSTRYNMIGSGNNQNTTTDAVDCALAPVYLTAVVTGNCARIYANGELIKQGDAGKCPLVNTHEPLRIGAQRSSNCWKGTIDEVRMRRGASSEAWVQADYAAQSSASFSTIDAIRAINTGTCVIVR